ncbi:hypothetical protein [Halorubrum sp. SP9]|uniref:hypothetical protein n=2 Tax=unclassified Halorubrum TaxID=2642239 RepID=UPI0010F6D90A|nr:hypothetical protein [Halorubrum sp. SP9]TKX68840.1 hypothetical protein EXE45_10285 [Halorubrum sp. SP9]
MLDKVRDKTESLVRKAADSDDPVLIESPPASGKTWNAVQLAANTEHKVTYLAGRVDLYEQAKTIAREDASLTVETIPSPHRDCPTFQGENDGDTDRVHQLYQKGIRARDIHFEGWDRVYTPCQTPDQKCPYIAGLDRLRTDTGYEDMDINDVDLLVGNHQHAYRESYLEDRVVIFDEFNPDPFVQRYPSEDTTSQVRDAPSEVISEFLETVENFPFDDLTDIIEARGADDPSVKEAIEWFEQYDANASAGKEIMAPSTRQYDASHTSAPLLTLGLLIAERIGPGIELADDNEVWENTGVDTGTRCLRDRNTNQMLVLSPPPLDTASQVIGMDALPTKKLWETVFNTEFELKQVLERKELDRYLREGLGFQLIQLADGMNHYSGGSISQKDDARFYAVRLIEDEKFPIITRKKALERYRNQAWFKRCVKPRNRIDAEISLSKEKTHAGQHYATVLSSNVFQAENLGVVSGSPYPNDDIIRRWAGLCGESTQAIRTNGTLDGFEGFGEQVYRHFTHHQVFQAILRFGRDLPPDKEGDVRVYINTQATPRWLTSINDLDVKKRKSDPKRVLVLEELIRAKRDKNSLNQQTVGTLRERLAQISESGTPRDGISEVSEKHIRNTLESEEFAKVIDAERNAGAGGADLYEWNGEEYLHQNPYVEEVDTLLAQESSAYFLRLNR